MAQTYEIDINRYNGTDYDTLLPTPATHASTHKANGTDPLVCQTGNYGDKTVTGAKMTDGTVGATQLASNAVETAKIKDAAVSRAKLANDALYSPLAYLNVTTEITVNAMDIGKTFYGNNNYNYVITVNKITGIPTGAEFAFFHRDGTMKIVFGSNVRVYMVGSNMLSAPTLSIPEKNAMVAIKKIDSYDGFDYFLVTGPAEVV